MDLGSLFLLIALLVIVSLFISRPFFEKRLAGNEEVLSRMDHDRSALMAERDRLLNALQELDFDYALGKIPQDEFPSQRAALLGRGAEVLRSLDSMEPSGRADKAEDRLEAMIAARRADTAPEGATPARRWAGATAVEAEEDLEIQLSARRRQRQEKSAGFCPHCGGPLLKSDRFCSKCGTTLRAGD